MLVSLSGAVKVLQFGNMADCGFTFKCEGRTRNGGFIIKPSQLMLAGVPKVYVVHLVNQKATREDGTVFHNVCVINKQYITVIRE